MITPKISWTNEYLNQEISSISSSNSTIPCHISPMFSFPSIVLHLSSSKPLSRMHVSCIGVHEAISLISTSIFILHEWYGDVSLPGGLLGLLP